jgi:hypothetical protein
LELECRLVIGGNLQWPVLRAKYNRASPALFVTPQFKGRQTGVVIGSEWKRQEWSPDGQDVVAKASYISICSQMVKGTSCRGATRLARAIFHQSHFDWGEPQWLLKNSFWSLFRMKSGDQKCLEIREDRL